MQDIRGFAIEADFEPKPARIPYDAEAEAGLAPISLAMRRFKHEYFYSTATIRAGDHEDLLELPFELAYALEQLPQWLSRLAGGDQQARLVFGGQGSERELIAERKREAITYWFRPFFSSGDESPRIRVDAGAFVREWTALTEKLMEKLVALMPELVEDPQFQVLRVALDRVKFV